MRTVNLSRDTDAAIFAREAALHFQAVPSSPTYAKDDPAPGEFLALKWNPHCVLVVQVADEFPPSLYNVRELGLKSDLAPHPDPRRPDLLKAVHEDLCAHLGIVPSENSLGDAVELVRKREDVRRLDAQALKGAHTVLQSLRATLGCDEGEDVELTAKRFMSLVDALQDQVATLRRERDTARYIARENLGEGASEVAILLAKWLKENGTEDTKPYEVVAEADRLAGVIGTSGLLKGGPVDCLPGPMHPNFVRARQESAAVPIALTEMPKQF